MYTHIYDFWITSRYLKEVLLLSGLRPISLLRSSRQRFVDSDFLRSAQVRAYDDRA